MSVSPTELGLYGGAFDPPHRGHVELARVAKQALGLERLLVLVAADPGHKHVETPADARLALARAAFPHDEVLLDEHARTIDLLRAHPDWDGATLVIGADQFADFRDWKEPDEVLRRVRLAVATRPGYPREELDAVLDRLERPSRVEFFDLEPIPVASSELRDRLAGGQDVSADLPPGAADLIRRGALYTGAD
jgi:nicotinate-nucleotide adenylyltransferase